MCEHQKTISKGKKGRANQTNWVNLNAKVKAILKTLEEVKYESRAVINNNSDLNLVIGAS